MLEFKKSFLLPLLLLACAGVYAQDFQEIALASYLTSNNSYRPNSIAWGDYDNDGDLDYAAMNLFTGANGIFKNTGNDNFLKIDSPGSLIAAYGSVNWGDFDKDGDLDLLYQNNNTCMILVNSGSDDFSEVIDIQEMEYNFCDARWFDFDLDGDLDIILAGENENEEYATDIYRNNQGVFTNSEIYIKGSQEIAIADYNKDNYPDLLLSGYEINGVRHVSLYRNNAGQSFTEQDTVHYPYQTPGPLLWCDFDNDSYPDILIQGDYYGPTNGTSMKLYHNNGDGSFSDLEIPFGNIAEGDFACGDYNNDGYADILVIGKLRDEGYSLASKLYKNNTDGTFTDQTAYSFTEINGNGAVSWGDYDADGDLDFMLSGKDNDNYGRVDLYKNIMSSTNTHPEIPDNQSSFTRGSSVDLSWDPATDSETPTGGLSYNVRVGTTPGGSEIVCPSSDPSSGYYKITEPGNAYQNTTFQLNKLQLGRYYWSVQAIDNGFRASGFSAEQSFTIVEDFTLTSDMENLSYSAASWGDCNNDNKLDLLVSGRKDIDTETVSLSALYKRDSVEYMGSYIDTFVISDPGLMDLNKGMVSWQDFDKDGMLDVLLGGRSTDNVHYLKIYRNLGNETFTELRDIPLAGNNLYSAHSGDYDNDGDLDLLVSSYGYTVIHRNNGDNTFTAQNDITFKDWSFNSAWADFDNDGDLDIIISGQENPTYEGFVSLFINQGDNTFSERELDSKISGAHFAWCDYDVDGDLDILINGVDAVYPGGNLFRNDEGHFTKMNFLIRKARDASAAWGDYDNDGYPDLVLTGNSGNLITRVYKNNAGDSFSEIDLEFPGVKYGSPTWGDYDRDGDLDLYLAGYINTVSGIADVYENNTNVVNYRPSAPTALKHELNGFEMKLRWDRASDPNLPDAAIYYNVKIGTTPGSGEIVSPGSDIISGERRVASIGNAHCNTFYILKDPVPGQKYYWSVQSIDHSFTGSEWSVVDSFIVRSVSPDFEFTTVCHGEATSFTDRSVTTDAIIAWKWYFGDGEMSVEQNPQHSYVDAGSYQVTQWVFSLSGDSAMKEYPVMVKARPEARFSVQPVCKDQPSQFVNLSSLNGTNIQTWTWAFENGEFSNVRGDIQKFYVESGTASLTLIADNGCSDTDMKNVIVADFPDATLSLLPGYSNQFCQGDSSKISVQYLEDYQYRWKLNGVSYSNSNDSVLMVKERSGIYSIEVENTVASCITTDEIEVSINTPPVAPPISYSIDPDGICPGDKLILSFTSQPDHSYQWKRDNIPLGIISDKLHPEQGGKYTLEIRDQNGCIGESTEAVEVSFLTAPEKPEILYNDGPAVYYLFCENNHADYYQWYLQDEAIPGANEYYYVANKDLGIYQLEIREDGKECSSMSDRISVPGGPLGSPSYEIGKELLIYPNPGRDIINWEFNASYQGRVTVSISTIEGRIMESIHLFKDGPALKGEFDLDISPGSYLFILETTEHRIASLLIRE